LWGSVTLIIIVFGALCWAPSRGADTQPSTAPAATQSIAAEQIGVLALNSIDAGRYLVKIAGCNDCHTAGWEQTGGNLPEALWLTGLPIGWRGPWGTTYASNLRLYVQGFTADTWVQTMRSRSVRPPMPWSSLHAMSDADLRAMYVYINALGPAGKPMPAFVPAGEEPTTPYFVMEPQAAGGFTTMKMLTPTSTSAPATGATATPVVQPTSAPTH
jgi:hypothetical protein